MGPRARATHRALDRAYAESEARDGRIEEGGSLLKTEVPTGIARPRKWRTDTVSGGQEPRVLLMELSERVSAKGRKYMSGFLGRASVVAFEAEEPDRFGNKCWRLFVSPQRQK